MPTQLCPSPPDEPGWPVVPARVSVRLSPKSRRAIQQILARYPRANLSEILNRAVVIIGSRKEPLAP